MKAERRYHLAFADLFFIGITALLGLGAINSQNNLLFVIFGIAIGAILVSGVLSGGMLLGVRVRRDITGERAVDRPIHIRYRVTNRNRFLPLFCLRIEEQLPDPDRGADRITPPLAFVAHAGAGETVLVDIYAWPRRRGDLRLDGIEVSTRFPFGLLRKSVTFHQPETILVQPQALPLRRETFARLRARGDRGQLSSRRQGRGEEFYGLRDYVPGDSLRLVAWRASARTGTLAVRETALPNTMRFMVILDLHRVNAGDTEAEAAAERAITLAASVLRETITRGCEAGLLVPGWGISHRPVNAPRYLSVLLDLLARINLEEPRHVGEEAEAPEPAWRSRLAPIIIHPGRAAPAHAERAAVLLSGNDLERHLRPLSPVGNDETRGTAP